MSEKVINPSDMRQIFEYDLRRKLSLRAKRSSSEMSMLLNTFKYFDIKNTGTVNKSDWIKTFEKIGLNGFSTTDLDYLFDVYDVNHCGLINYKNFSGYIYDQVDLEPLPANQQNQNEQQVPQQMAPNNQTNQMNQNNYNQKYEQHYDQPPSQMPPQSQMNQNDMRMQQPQYEKQPPQNNYYKNQNPQGDDMQRYQGEDYNQMNNQAMMQQKQVINQNQNQNYNNNMNSNNNLNNMNDMNNLNNMNNMNNMNSNMNNNDYQIPKCPTPLRLEYKKYFRFLLQEFRDKINTRNGVTLYSFISRIKNYEDKLEKSINIGDFQKSLADIQVNINDKYIIEFFSVLDICDTGKIQSSELIRLMKGELSEERKMSIVQQFAQIDIDRKGECEIELIKKLYNPAEHPDVKMGKRTPQDIYDEFLYTFDIFLNYKELQVMMSFEDFIEYYHGISASIENENYFNDMINGVWSKTIPQEIPQIQFQQNAPGIQPQNMGMNEMGMGQKNANQNINQAQNMDKGENLNQMPMQMPKEKQSNVSINPITGEQRNTNPITGEQRNMRPQEMENKMQNNNNNNNVNITPNQNMNMNMNMNMNQRRNCSMNLPPGNNMMNNNNNIFNYQEEKPQWRNNNFNNMNQGQDFQMNYNRQNVQNNFQQGQPQQNTTESNSYGNFIQNNNNAQKQKTPVYQGTPNTYGRRYNGNRIRYNPINGTYTVPDEQENNSNQRIRTGNEIISGNMNMNMNMNALNRNKPY